MDERNEQDEAEAGEQKALNDLDVDQDDADKVIGGVRRVGDPCDGGE
jgi:hypothetical protein